MNLVFEAPVEWIIENDDSAGQYVLRNPEGVDGVHTRLIVRKISAENMSEEEMIAQLRMYGEPVEAELLGVSGLYVDYCFEEQGRTYAHRDHVVILDGMLYDVIISTSPERFDAEVKEIFEPFCASMRLLP